MFDTKCANTFYLFKIFLPLILLYCTGGWKRLLSCVMQSARSAPHQQSLKATWIITKILFHWETHLNNCEPASGCQDLVRWWPPIPLSSPRDVKHCRRLGSQMISICHNATQLQGTVTAVRLSFLQITHLFMRMSSDNKMATCSWHVTDTD